MHAPTLKKWRPILYQLTVFFFHILEDARYHDLWSEWEMIETCISTCDLQRQLNKGKCRSNEVAKSPRLHIEHKHSHDKTILTRTFLVVKESFLHQLVSWKYPSLLDVIPRFYQLFLLLEFVQASQPHSDIYTQL